MDREQAGKHYRLEKMAEVMLGDWGVVEVGTESSMSSSHTMLLAP